MIELDFDDTVALLSQCVEERGTGWVFPDEWKMENQPLLGMAQEPTCTYRQPAAQDQPACLIGMMIVKAGGNLSEVKEGTGASEATYDAGLDLSSSASMLVDNAQSLQDSGLPWGRALEEAVTIFR